MAEPTWESVAAAWAPTPLAVVDADGLVVWTNAAFATLTGYDRDEVAGRAPETVLRGPATDPAAAEALRDLSDGRSDEPVAALLHRKDSTPVWLECAVAHPGDGEAGGEHAVWSFHDISARKQAEAALAKLDRTVAEIEMMAGIGSWELDLKSNTVAWSEGAYRLQDADSRLRDMPLSEMLDRFPDDARDLLIETMERLVADRRPFGLELPFTTRANRRVWLHVRCRANVNPFTGEVDRLFGVIQDITERREYEREVLEAREDAARADHAKTAFLANISHEIRTPLNGVMGMLQLIAQEKLEPATLSRVQTAYNSAESLLAILNDIIDMAQLEAGQYHIRDSVFDPGVITREACAVFEAQTADKGLALEVEIDPRTPRSMAGDGGRVRQVLTNLISNAVKYTDSGSVRVHVQCRGDLLRFMVTDTGCGIPRNRHAKLFRHFAPLDTAENRRHGGAGLGLAISRNLVERMGGAIDLDSDEGRGTRIWFDLPMTGARAERAGAPSRAHAEPLNGAGDAATP